MLKRTIGSLILALLILTACDNGTPASTPPPAKATAASQPLATRLAPDTVATASGLATSQPLNPATPLAENTRLAQATAAEAAAATAVATAGAAATVLPLNQPTIFTATLVGEMKKGGLTIYIRHGERNAFDEPNLPDMKDCKTQNILTPLGIEQAKQVGTAYQTLAIPVGEVYSGEFCRNKDSAMLGFGKDTVLPELDRFNPRVVPTIQQLLSTPPAAGKNTIIVNHHAALAQAANIKLIGYAESAVFRPLGGGKFQFLGYLTLSEISQLAVDAVSP